MEHKDNKKLFIIVGCLLLVMGVSLAYFVGRTLFSGNGSSVSGTTATINGAEVNVEGKLTFNDLDILPGHKNVSSIKVTATGNNELIPFNLIWNGTNTLNTPLNFTVYKSDSEINVSTTCERKTKVENGLQLLNEECTITNLDSLGSIISSGTINKAETTAKVTLAPDEFITATSTGNTVYYYVILEYPNLNESQNIDMGGSFDGIVTVEASNATADINIIAIYQENEDGSYKEITSIPNKGAGYILNRENSTCTNNAKPTWNKEDWSLEVNTLTTSGTDCSLYFKIDTTMTSTERIQAMGLTATAGPTSFTGPSASDEARLLSEEDDDGTTYYFRGNVTNNWVQFAGFYWRIIRINGDGSIRMIYNGITTDQTGETTQIEISKYSHADAYYNSSEDNAYVNDNTYIGYMYGLEGASTYESTHSNTTNSAVKYAIDAWYKTNIADKGYSSKISTEAGFCNDRSIASSSDSWWVYDTKKGYGTNATVYGPFSRILKTDGNYNSTQTPTLKCPQIEDDLFTVSMSAKGNKALTYPVGLITADEAIYAGGFGNTSNRNYYLYTNKYYWTMSPYVMDTFGWAGMFFMHAAGSIAGIGVYNTSSGIRPVINLSSDVKLSGSGTTSDPYKVVE